MKKLLLPIILLAMVTATAQRDYTQYVNPIIGTNGMGHTFPGACYPFGGVQVSPDTDTIPHIPRQDHRGLQPHPLQRHRPLRYGRHPADALHRRNAA